MDVRRGTVTPDGRQAGSRAPLPRISKANPAASSALRRRQAGSDKRKRRRARSFHKRRIPPHVEAKLYFWCQFWCQLDFKSRASRCLRVLRRNRAKSLPALEFWLIVQS